MHSLRRKLLLYILPLCLTPLIGISVFSYYQAKERITEDRTVLYLEQIAVEIADTIRLTLLEKREETISMTLYSEFRNYLLGRTSRPPQLLLDQLLAVHEVYDLLVLFDADGNIVLTNTINRTRFEETLDGEKISLLRGQKVTRHTADSAWLQEVRSGYFGYSDWFASDMVRDLYDYGEDDVARHYGISFAAPIMDERGVVIGGILAIMNWEFLQEILDKVEADLEERSLSSGYAFLFGSDGDTVIGHKYRRNRNYDRLNADDAPVVRDTYGLRLVEDLGLNGLRQAVSEGAPNYRYQYPAGVNKISGLAPVDHEYFQWICGIGINDEDIFAPVQELAEKLIWVASLSALAVVLLTFSVARQITTPLKKLTVGARVIAGGDLSQRVDVSSRDEIGELATTFNEMAASLEDRSRALLDLNKRLEEKVRERTAELEETNKQVQEAYQELKQTQVQLIQSEKMASLGQLVAGIGHEIKNPLNFIYGNTDFLKSYVLKLKQLIALYESEVSLSTAGVEKVEALKKEINYSFMLEDLGTLIHNFEEGAERIHSVITDLKTFSRMDSDQFQPVDVREPIDLALNLLHNEYRDRIEIHRDYGAVPRLSCHPGKLSQVFMNLLANACHAIPEEGDIWIRTSRQNGRAIIEIEDNGLGIREEHLGKVFEPFFTTKPVGEGTGLGLSISYGIIQQHQGEIGVESEPGKGTKFRVSLPLNTAAAQTELQADQQN